MITRLVNFHEEMEEVSREDLKRSIKNFFDAETRDELLTRDRFYLALALDESELRYFLVYYLQDTFPGEQFDENRLWSYIWVQNFESAYFN